MIKTDDDCLHQANYQEFHDYGDCFQRGIHHNFGDVGTAYFLFFCFAICAWGLFDLIPPKHPRFAPAANGLIRFQVLIQSGFPFQLQDFAPSGKVSAAGRSPAGQARVLPCAPK